MCVAHLPSMSRAFLRGLLTMDPGCLVPDRQMSERDGLGRPEAVEQFQRLKEQFVKDQEVGAGPGRGWAQGPIA